MGCIDSLLYRTMIKSFLDLEVYKDSFQLQLEVEELLKEYPPSEKFLLVDQTKRCCRSIPAIIAEAYAKRESIKEFQKYMRDCIGEANEMINHLLLAKNHGFIKDSNYAIQLIERYTILGKKLYNLKNNWQNFK